TVRIRRGAGRRESHHRRSAPADHPSWRTPVEALSCFDHPGKTGAEYCAGSTGPSRLGQPHPARPVPGGSPPPREPEPLTTPASSLLDRGGESFSENPGCLPGAVPGVGDHHMQYTCRLILGRLIQQVDLDPPLLVAAVYRSVHRIIDQVAQHRSDVIGCTDPATHHRVITDLQVHPTLGGFHALGTDERLQIWFPKQLCLLHRIPQ